MDQRQDEVNRLRDDASCEEIRRGIQHTRREMDETIDEIGTRLHPRHILDDVIDMVRSKFSSDGGGANVGEWISEATRRTGRTLGQQVREHPLPALLIGAGLVWWVADACHDDDEFDDYGDDLYRSNRPDYEPGVSPLVVSEQMAAGEPGDPMVGPEGSGKPGMGAKVREKAQAAGEKVSEAGSKIAQAGHTAKGRLSAAGHDAADRLSSAGSAVGDAATASWKSARRGGRKAYYGTRRVSRWIGGEVRDGWEEAQRGLHLAQRKTGEAVEDYPFAVGAAALAAGLLVGALIPRTRYEHELMGEASEEALSRAKHAGQEALERAETVAARTATAAIEEAEHQGLTPESVGEKLENFVSKVGQSAKEAAEEEDLKPSQLRDQATKVAEEAAKTAQRESKKEASEFSKSQT